MRAIASLGLVLAIVAAACLPPAGTLFKTTVVQPDGSYPLPVALGDQTGLVTAIEPIVADGSGSFELAVKADPDNANALILTWIGGACDDDVAIALARSESGFSLFLDTKAGFGACMALGLFRAIRIRVSEPIAADSIAVTEKR
jgi:hypothetical protein